MVHVRLGGIERIDIPDDERPAGQQHLVCPVHEIRHTSVPQIVAQRHAADQRRWRERSMPPTLKQSNDVALRKRAVASDADLLCDTRGSMSAS